MRDTNTFLSLDELSTLVEKSGNRFKAALARERDAAEFETAYARIKAGRSNNNDMDTYMRLAKTVRDYYSNAPQSSAYHAAGLVDYARRAAHLALVETPKGEV